MISNNPDREMYGAIATGLLFAILAIKIHASFGIIGTFLFLYSLNVSFDPRIIRWSSTVRTRAAIIAGLFASIAPMAQQVLNID